MNKEKERLLEIQKKLKEKSTTKKNLKRFYSLKQGSRS
jgi:hypothetical protein